MSDAKAGVLVMLAGVAIALVGVFMWQGVCGAANRVSWNNAFPHFGVEVLVTGKPTLQQLQILPS